jgi:hypothetical protein
MSRVVRLEDIETARAEREGYGRYGVPLALAEMMPERRGGRKLRVSPDTFNTGLISRCPGSSRMPGLDFVKAVYAERTGQE